MHWRHSPAVLEKLAAAYALGTLAGPARRRFETIMRSHPPAARAVADWNRRLAPLAARLPTQGANARLWERIERRAFGSAAHADARVDAPAAAQRPARSPAAAQPPWWRRAVEALRPRLSAGTLATGMAFGLAFGLVLPGALTVLQGEPATALPESYVGVLATAQGRTGLIVSSLRHGMVMDVKRVTEVPVPPGMNLYLWAIDANGQPSPIGPVPQGAFVRVPLPTQAERLFAKAAELGVSLEGVGTQPTAPTSPYAYRGLCGKLWRVPRT